MWNRPSHLKVACVPGWRWPLLLLRLLLPRCGLLLFTATWWSLECWHDDEWLLACYQSHKPLGVQQELCNGCV